MTRESQIFDDDQAIFDLAVRVGEALTQREWMLVTCLLYTSSTAMVFLI